jgi:hypothetical protein
MTEPNLATAVAANSSRFEPSAPTPLSVAPRPQAPPPPALSFEHSRLPGVTLLPSSEGITLRMKSGAELLSPTQARSLASALFAFAELAEPKREPRGSGWRPS